MAYGHFSFIIINWGEKQHAYYSNPGYYLGMMLITIGLFLCRRSSDSWFSRYEMFQWDKKTLLFIKGDCVN